MDTNSKFNPILILLNFLNKLHSRRGLLSAPKLFFLVVFMVLSLTACTGRFNVEGGWAAPLISGDTLFVGTRDGKILALDKRNGTTKWMFPIEDSIEPVYATPALSKDGILYIGGYDGDLYAINTANINTIANVPTLDEARVFSSGGSIIASPVISGDTIVVASSNGSIYSLNRTTGALNWKFETGNKIWSTPVIDGSNIYFGSLDHNFYALNLENGKELWNFPTGAAIAAQPLVIDGNIYIGSFDGIFYSIKKNTGQEIERFEADNWFWATPLYNKSIIYIGSFDHNLYALNQKTLTSVWPSPLETDGQIIGGPVIVDDWIAVPSDDENIYVAHISNGTQLHICNVKTSIKADLSTDGDIIYAIGIDKSVRAIRIDVNGNPNEIWTRYTDKDYPEPRTAGKVC